MTESPVKPKKPKKARKEVAAAQERDERQKARRLESLRQWLASAPWTVNEAAHILAGVEPGYGPSSDQAGGWKALPELKTPEPKDDWFGFDRNMEASIDDFWRPRLASVPGIGTISNHDLLSYLTAKGFLGSSNDADIPGRTNHTPPWLPTAQADPVCAEHLPEGWRLAEWRADVAHALAADPHSDGGSRTDDSHLVACFALWILREDARELRKRIPGAKTGGGCIARALSGSRYAKIPSPGTFKRWVGAFGKGETPALIYEATFSRNARKGAGLTVESARAEAERLLRPYLGKSANN